MENILDLLSNPYNKETNSQGEFIKYRKEVVQTIIAELEKFKTSKFCETCTFDGCGCSVQDSILRCDESATFETFGCINHELKENLMSYSNRTCPKCGSKAFELAPKNYKELGLEPFKSNNDLCTCVACRINTQKLLKEQQCKTIEKVKVGDSYRAKINGKVIVVILSNIEYELEYPKGCFKKALCVSYTNLDSPSKIFFKEQEEFLESYKPYKPVCEYQWAYTTIHGNKLTEYMTEEAFDKGLTDLIEKENVIAWEKLEITKRIY